MRVKLGKKQIIGIIVVTSLVGLAVVFAVIKINEGEKQIDDVLAVSESDTEGDENNDSPDIVIGDDEDLSDLSSSQAEPIAATVTTNNDEEKPLVDVVSGQDEPKNDFEKSREVYDEPKVEDDEKKEEDKKDELSTNNEISNKPEEESSDTTNDDITDKKNDEEPEDFAGTKSIDQEEAKRELYAGNAYIGNDTYKWKEDCPEKQDYYITYIEDVNGTHKIGGYVCESISYVAWKAYEAYGLSLEWGNAYNWDDGARAAGYRVDHTPESGSIGQIDGYPYGHVFWVEGVNKDGSINVTEYNNSYSTYLYSGVSQYGSFGSRRIAASENSQYNFIHLK